MYEEFESELRKAKNQDDLNKLKQKIAKKYHLQKFPKNIELASTVSAEARAKYRNLLTIKPTRIASGVNVVAVMTKPHSCPKESPCTYCPGGLKSSFGDMPQSYTGNEPATRRAIRNHYDPYLQVMNRLEQYAAMNKLSGKIELIIMGGTFLSTPSAYQDSFVKYCFKAMNDFSKMFYSNNSFKLKKFLEFFELPGDIKDEKRTVNIRKKLLKLRKICELEKEKLKNEKSNVRCVALCIETRPDWSDKKQISQMLRLGCTRVEIGAQTVYDPVLKKINREHDVQATINATQLLKDSFLKVGYQMMPGLPGSNPKKDIEMFKELFSNPDFMPDNLKIYPCMVMPGTKLHSDWKSGKFNPLTTEQAAELIIKAKKHVPEWCRIMRVQRDIPTKVISAGVGITNLRQYLQNDKNYSCRCIRCREPGSRKLEIKNIQIKTTEYEASNGTEFFISAEDAKQDIIAGFCRLRKPHNPFRKELKDCVGIRELHVYGEATPVSEKGAIQHQGIGKRLMAEAERIAKEKLKAKKIAVISGIGVKQYYQKLGYKKDGMYMIKTIPC